MESGDHSFTGRIDGNIPARVRRRGEKAFADGTVHCLRETPEWVLCSIQGGREATHQVRLYFNRRGVPCAWVCSCPYPQICCHVYAAFLEAETAGRPLTERGGMLKEQEETRPYASACGIRPNVGRLIQGEMQRKHSGQSARSAGKEPENRPIFALEWSAGHIFTIHSPNEGSTPFCTATEKEALLLEILLSTPAGKVPFQAVQSLLAPPEGIRLYLENDGEYTPVTVCRASFFKIRFDVRIRGFIIGLRPIIAIDSGDTVECADPAGMELDGTGPAPMLLDRLEKRLIILPTLSSEGLSFLRFITRYMPVFSTEEVEHLRELFDSPKFRMAPAPEILQPCLMQPEPVVFLQPVEESVLLHVFSYYPFQEGAADKEGHVVIGNKCMEQMQRQDIMQSIGRPPGSVHPALIQQPLPVFLARHGPMLLNRCRYVYMMLKKCRRRLRSIQDIHVNGTRHKHHLEIDGIVDDIPVNWAGFLPEEHLLPVGRFVFAPERTALKAVEILACASRKIPGRTLIKLDETAHLKIVTKVFPNLKVRLNSHSDE